MTAGATPESDDEGTTTGYTVRVSQGTTGWEVQVLRPGREVAFIRPCSNEAEARTFASTVHQHIYWLSQEKFEDYYRLEGQKA